MAAENDYLTDPGSVHTKLGAPGLAARRVVFKVLEPHFEQARLRARAAQVAADAAAEAVERHEALLEDVLRRLSESDDRVAQLEKQLEKQVAALTRRIEEIDEASAGADERVRGVEIAVRAINRRIDVLDDAAAAGTAAAASSPAAPSSAE